jgi:preprotein translocase subunit SecD
MEKSIRWKILLIIGVLGLCLFLALPLGEKINLGLDLRGGMHLVLKVKTDKAIEMYTDQRIEGLKTELKDLSVSFDSISKPKRATGEDGNTQWVEDTIIVKNIRFEDKQKIEDYLDKNFVAWNVSYSAKELKIKMKEIEKRKMKNSIVNQSIENIRNRVDKYGVAETGIQRQGLRGDSEEILVQLPGIDDEERVKEIITTTALLEWKHVVSGPFDSKEEALAKYDGFLPDDLVLHTSNPRTMGKKAFYVLRRANVITGNEINRASRANDRNGLPAVGFLLKGSGASRFEAYTSKNIGQRLSIVLDNQIESVATVNAIISYDGIITGNYSLEQVNVMVLMLNSGALPAEMEILYEKIVGPSLGADSIKKGVFSIVFGLLLVVVFMLVYYKGAGINSILALFFNVIILMGFLAYFDATLTLPGIAGILLTIGMAVDANVLVFERIKEELREGKSPKAAIDSGFKKAFVTIFDANLTTAIAAVFLFQFGTGPIKGFAVTLIIGISASVFTAVFVSRTIFELVYYSRKKINKISI